MKKLETYLFFDGNCAEAMRFYERVLNGKLHLVQAKDTPGGSGDAIIHSRLEADGAILMASDWMAPAPFERKSGFYVTLTAPTAAEAKALWDQLADGAKINMPLGKTFYADAFGMLIDRYGTPWMVMSEASTGS
jgi:PhnB protein